MTASVVYSPFLDASPIELAGGRWRKLVLPVGNISYQGRTLRFTPDYLAGLARAFRSRAYDQVPFQIADATNAHTNDPERYRGQVTGMQADQRGLWIEVEPTEAGAQLLATNPNLGVSARIIEGYDRADGVHYEAAIQHVLGTLDPRIPALGPWQPVETSNSYGGHVLDLSNYGFEGYHRYTDLAAEAAQEDGYWAAIAEADTDAELSELLSMTPQDFAQSQRRNNAGAGYDVSEGEDSDDSHILTDEELDELQAWAEGQDPETREAVRHLVGASASLSNDSYALAMELANMGMGVNVDAATVLGERETAGDWSQIDLAVQARQEETARQMDQGRAYWQAEASRARRGRVSDEQRLARACGRIMQDNYLPDDAVAFSNTSEREILLSQLRDGQAGHNPLDTCGQVDDYGNCLNSSHLAACSAVIDPDYWAGEEGRQALALTAVTPIDGILPSDAVEASIGVRLTHENEGPFEADRGPDRGTYSLSQWARPRFGDPDADEPDGVPADAATAVMVGQLKSLMGISSPERGSRAARQVMADSNRAASRLPGTRVPAEGWGRGDSRSTQKAQTPAQRAGLDSSHLQTMQERRAQVSQRSVVPLEIEGMVVGLTKAAF